jgi:hypothetical protein
VKGLVFKAFSANYPRIKLNSTNAQRSAGEGIRSVTLPKKEQYS